MTAMEKPAMSKAAHEQPDSNWPLIRAFDEMSGP